MAYGNYGFYDAENAAEAQKRAQEQVAREAEMERRRQEQIAYERARQAFQEQIIAQEQARRQAETANQYQLGLDSNNVQRQLSKDQWDAKQSMTRMTVGGMRDMFGQFSGMFGGDQSNQTTLKDNAGNVIGGSFANSGMGGGGVGNGVVPQQGTGLTPIMRQSIRKNGTTTVRYPQAKSEQAVGKGGSSFATIRRSLLG